MAIKKPSTQTIKELYSRFHTAMAMAKTEGWTLRGKIEAEIAELRALADRLEKFLAREPTREIDSWYETILEERRARGE